jgi:hypothetical protein
MNATYTIKYNRTTNHIAGLDIRTAGSEMNYSQNACPTLTRSVNFAEGKTSTDLREILKSAKINGRKVCKHCEKAAEAMIAAMPAPVVITEMTIAAPRTAHADCAHAATKVERAKCRKARATLAA